MRDTKFPKHFAGHLNSFYVISESSITYLTTSSETPMDRWNAVWEAPVYRSILQQSLVQTDWTIGRCMYNSDCKLRQGQEVNIYGTSSPFIVV
jgi:hypothetical protein